MEKINIGPSFIGNNFIPENNIGESIKILANKINEIIDVLSDCELKTPAKWVPEYDEEYFFISDHGSIVRTWFANIEGDRFRLKNNNVFRTEKEAKKELNKIMNS